MCVAQKLFAPMEFKSLLIWFLYLIAPLFKKRLIFRYFIYKRNALTIRRFLDWGGCGARALNTNVTLAVYFRFVLVVQIARAWFNQQPHKSYHYFH